MFLKSFDAVFFKIKSLQNGLYIEFDVHKSNNFIRFQFHINLLFTVALLLLLCGSSMLISLVRSALLQRPNDLYSPQNFYSPPNLYSWQFLGCCSVPTITIQCQANDMCPHVSGIP